MYTNQFFTDIYRLVVLTVHTDAYNARSGDFHADDNDNDNDDRQTNRLLYPLCMRAG